MSLKELNEIYLRRKKVYGEIAFLKTFLSEKDAELKVLDEQYQEIQIQMRKPDFSKITKKELVKCFSHEIKPEEVYILVEREGICYSIKNVRELETETELWVRLNTMRYNPILIYINEDRSFNILDKK